MGHIPQGKPAADQQKSQSLTISIIYYLLHSGNQRFWRSFTQMFYIIYINIHENKLGGLRREEYTELQLDSFWTCPRSFTQVFYITFNL